LALTRKLFLVHNTETLTQYEAYECNVIYLMIIWSILKIWLVFVLLLIHKRQICNQDKN